ncbi:zinc ribbon domain-containing protein [Haloquadratum walsbyi]|jgi:Transposase and inactivated derivatives|uniref:Transposase n=1 Tax=Haloquadratum walsbyi J07HQW2 TaxID=1238425 RepID=U1NC45_9EURY|nr:zinc ribbon domain-containing protein [Haloquadratum walsbyi]ERG94253.1 MAG: transposase [Haloquadratum walsbyi J07HQW2]
MSWYATIQAFARHFKENGCHAVLVDPDGTTKQCVNCGGETETRLRVREHSCQRRGFTADREYNASLEVHQRGFEELQLGV